MVNMSLNSRGHSPLSEAEAAELCDILFPDLFSLPTLGEIEKKYPARSLSAGAMVVRFAPSPTGFMHLGAVYAALINRRFAAQTGGVFFLRIEDTDQKRQVEGAFEIIVRALGRYGVAPDEGFCEDPDGTIRQHGSYGPYAQSGRTDLYRAHVAYLVRAGLAYPCFASEVELKELGEQQQLERQRPGYYARWALWRDAPLAQIKQSLDNNLPFVIRFRSWGDYQSRVSWTDAIHTTLHQPENDLDAVLLKSDGTSLYHLAHVVDDHFMRVTHVIRGDEWLSSVPLHRQLFEALGYDIPVYAHLAPVQKIEVIEVEEDGKVFTRESRRKLSKRKDPEASVTFYEESGYPNLSVVEYLLHLADSGFEPWRATNENLPFSEFSLNLDHFSRSGALVDLEKLLSISRDVVSRMPIADIYAQALQWCKTCDPEIAELMMADPAYAMAVLDIERTGAKASKRIGCWRDIRPQTWWFFDKLFAEHQEFTYPDSLGPADVTAIIAKFLDLQWFELDKDAWFLMCQGVASDLGYAATMKEFKKGGGGFKAHIGDVTMVLRVALSGLSRTPDLHQMIQVMGADRVIQRLSRASARLAAPV